MLTVYPDQNVFGHILDSDQDWRQHPLVHLLEENPDEVELWVSPTHILELIQCSDSDRRQELAKIMLHLCGGTKMGSGSDFWIVDSFGQFLNDFVSDAYDPRPFVSKYEENAKQLWLGYLGLFAASDRIPLGDGAQYVRVAKAQTELIQARIAADPEAAITQIIKQAKSLETTQDPDPLKLDGMTPDEIQAEIHSLRQRARRPSKKQRTNLIRHRAQICRAYGAIDIGVAICSVFSTAFPLDLELTFDAPAIARGWERIVQNTGCHGLPKDVVTVTDDRLRYDRTYVVSVLNHAFQAAAHAQLPAASAGYYSTLRELEMKLNQKSTPKGSVALDASHATACTRFSVFLCRDGILHDSMRTFTKQLAKDCPELPIAEVIKTTGELKALLRRLGRSNG